MHLSRVYHCDSNEIKVSEVFINVLCNSGHTFLTPKLSLYSQYSFEFNKTRKYPSLCRHLVMIKLRNQNEPRGLAVITINRRGSGNMIDGPQGTCHHMTAFERASSRLNSKVPQRVCVRYML